MKLVAATIDDVIGKIKTPPGPQALYGDPIYAASRLLTFGIRMVFFAASIILLIYFLWGALNWISSEGDKEKITKARSKLTNAFIGILILVVSLSLYVVISGDLLGLIERTDGGFKIKLPTLGGSAPAGGGGGASGVGGSEVE